MISYSVQSDIDKAFGKLQAIVDKKQWDFATARALTWTAKDVQAEVVKNMRSRFKIRREWVINGIRIKPVSKNSVNGASIDVYSRDYFMGLQEFGGDKIAHNKYIAIPTKMVRTRSNGIIPMSDRPKALGDRVEQVVINGTRFLALKKGRKSKKNGAKLRLLYVLVPKAKIGKKLHLADDGLRIAKSNFIPNFQKSLEDAIRTAR